MILVLLSCLECFHHFIPLYFHSSLGSFFASSLRSLKLFTVAILKWSLNLFTVAILKLLSYASFPRAYLAGLLSPGGSTCALLVFCTDVSASGVGMIEAILGTDVWSCLCWTDVPSLVSASLSRP